MLVRTEEFIASATPATSIMTAYSGELHGRSERFQTVDDGFIHQLFAAALRPQFA